MSLNRREFLAQAGFATSCLALSGAAEFESPQSILLRSSWQTVNIGDIAHTPGVLRLLETHLPQTQVYLYPSNVDNGVDQLLTSRFPKLKIAKKGTRLLEEAYERCDLMLHGSGPSLVAERDLVDWQQQTGKPFGVFGITLAPQQSSSTTADSKEAVKATASLLSDADFVYFRDSKSLEFAKQIGVNCPVMEFGPDGAFACDLRDDAKAESFLSASKLQTGKFLCCIPRLRYTPYWTIKENSPFDAVKHRRNEEMKEHDHAPLREAIIEVIRNTDLKVLLCPEDRTQMEIGRELLYNKLPSDVVKRVVWRPDYWLTGEAVSTYTRSAGLFGNEMHSPILCIGHGVPAIVCRFSEQTSKGYMWQDIGLGDWLFDLDDNTQVQKIVPTVLNMAQDPETARDKALQAKAFVERRHKETLQRLQKRSS
jgi:polysaccharide pyruvyl transferase WcaK-like protein